MKKQHIIFKLLYKTFYAIIGSFLILFCHVVADFVHELRAKLFPKSNDVIEAILVYLKEHCGEFTTKLILYSSIPLIVFIFTPLLILFTVLLNDFIMLLVHSLCLILSYSSKKLFNKHIYTFNIENKLYNFCQLLLGLILGVITATILPIMVKKIV